MILLERKKLNRTVVDREKKILELCKSKSILHLGCADHPFSVERHIAGTLLHEKLSRIANRIWGVDCSIKGIDFLKSLGYENLIVGDVEDCGKLDLREKYDVILAGELLEHLSNVGRFFENVIRTMSDDSILIITVPSAHSIKSFLRVLLGNELVHADHLYYFSPATIEHICKRYKCEFLEYCYYLSEPHGILRKIVFVPVKYFIKLLCPSISDGLIFVLKKGVDSG